VAPDGLLDREIAAPFARVGVISVSIRSRPSRRASRRLCAPARSGRTADETIRPTCSTRPVERRRGGVRRDESGKPFKEAKRPAELAQDDA
jgi:hypothetical protein